MALFDNTRPANSFSGSKILGDPLQAPAPIGAPSTGTVTSPPDTGFSGVTGPLALGLLGGAGGTGIDMNTIFDQLAGRLGGMGGGRGGFEGFAGAGGVQSGDFYPGIDRRRTAGATRAAGERRRASSAFGPNASAFRNLFIPGPAAPRVRGIPTAVQPRGTTAKGPQPAPGGFQADPGTAFRNKNIFLGG